jgi:hypothetical protein
MEVTPAIESLYFKRLECKQSAEMLKRQGIGSGLQTLIATQNNSR